MTAVLHVMRTYGVHGGERQLSQLFAQSHVDFQEHFAFIYRDKECRDYFSSRSTIKIHELFPIGLAPRKEFLAELLILFTLFPTLQMLLFLLIKRINAKIVIAHGFHAACICSLLARVMKDVSFVYMHRGRKSTLGKLSIFKWLYQPFKVIAGVSHSTIESIKELTPNKPTRVIPNGIDIEEINQLAAVKSNPHGKLTIVMVGRLITSKGHSFVINAIAPQLKMSNDVQLLIVGNGPLHSQLQSLVTTLKIHTQVHFAGKLSQPQTIQAVSKSDIFLCASHAEGMSNAVLEAMVLGKPSLVVDAPGVSECHIDRKTALIVQRDETQFSQQLLKLVQAPELRDQLGSAAKEHVKQHYSIERNRKNYYSLYQSLNPSKHEIS